MVIEQFLRYLQALQWKARQGSGKDGHMWKASIQMLCKMDEVSMGGRR